MGDRVDSSGSQSIDPFKIPDTPPKAPAKTQDPTTQKANEVRKKTPLSNELQATRPLLNPDEAFVHTPPLPSNVARTDNQKTAITPLLRDASDVEKSLTNYLGIYTNYLGIYVDPDHPRMPDKFESPGLPDDLRKYFNDRVDESLKGYGHQLGQKPWLTTRLFSSAKFFFRALGKNHDLKFSEKLKKSFRAFSSEFSGWTNIKTGLKNKLKEEQYQNFKRILEEEFAPNAVIGLTNTQLLQYAKNILGKLPPVSKSFNIVLSNKFQGLLLKDIRTKKRDTIALNTIKFNEDQTKFAEIAKKADTRGLSALTPAEKEFLLKKFHNHLLKYENRKFDSNDSIHGDIEQIKKIYTHVAQAALTQRIGKTEDDLERIQRDLQMANFSPVQARKSLTELIHLKKELLARLNSLPKFQTDDPFTMLNVATNYAEISAKLNLAIQAQKDRLNVK